MYVAHFKKPGTDTETVMECLCTFKLIGRTERWLTICTKEHILPTYLRKNGGTLPTCAIARHQMDTGDQLDMSFCVYGEGVCYPTDVSKQEPNPSSTCMFTRFLPPNVHFSSA